MDDRSDVRRPFETILAILIAVAAALSGTAGYLSAESKNMENGAKGLSLKEQNLANTYYLDANQMFILDVDALREAEIYEIMADVQGNESYREIAYYIRNTTVLVMDGYLDYKGEVTAKYGGDYELAMNAYDDSLYADYRTHLLASELAALDAQHHSQMSSSYLLSTVFMAFSGVLATIGITASMWKIRLLMVGLVVIVMGLSSIFIVIATIG